MQEFALSAFETPEGIEASSGSVVPVTGIRKQFSNFMLNQLDTDPYSCTLYSTWNVLGNLTGLSLSKERRKAVFDKMVSDGKMRPGFGALIDDGMRYALDAFNAEFGTFYVPHKILLSANSIMSALAHSGIVTGIRFSSAYFSDEQDDGRISKKPSEISGNNGHSVSVIKMNTEDASVGQQFKIQENYAGRLVYNVVYFPTFEKSPSNPAYSDVFFKTGFYFTK